MFSIFRRVKVVQISPNISVKQFDKKQPPILVSDEIENSANITNEVQKGGIKVVNRKRIRKTPLSKRKSPRKKSPPKKKKSPPKR